MENRPIADYALISDCNSSALVSSMGSIDWLCLPDFDSQSVFGRILDADAGYWSIVARQVRSTRRRYVTETMVLETTFDAESGLATVTDAMALDRGACGHEIGKDAPHRVVRGVTCHSGEVTFDFEYAPRPEYGLVIPLMSLVEGGVQSRGGAASVLLSTPVTPDTLDGIVRFTFSVAAGKTLYFAMQYFSLAQDLPRALAQAEIADSLSSAIAVWRSWSDLHQGYTGPWRSQVAHSGRVLQALTYYPTGAIVAAPTTSLPEVIGGDRNWDYRFTWVRDASFTMEALWVAACPDEAHKFFDFLAGAALTQVRRGDDLQIMFGIRGEHDLSERTLPHLRGWNASVPVRVGNGAWNQRQLDVYGELMGAVFLLREHLTELDSTTLEFLVDIVDSAASRWNLKDQGIWEIRGEPRHFLYSKLMCWVALDRGIRLAPLLRAEAKLPTWCEKRDRIREAILSEGWSQKAGAFTQAFGSDALDASSLMLPIVGFLPPTDPKVLSTIDSISRQLTDQHGLVYRYISDDGLSGKEGSFLLCTFWLAQAQAMAGRVDSATETFNRAIGFMNDVGLLAEEVLPDTRELLGNFPQAFSHIGLINAAWAIAQATVVAPV